MLRKFSKNLTYQKLQLLTRRVSKYFRLYVLMQQLYLFLNLYDSELLLETNANFFAYSIVIRIVFR